MNPKQWALFVIIKNWLRGGSYGFKIMILFFLFLMSFYLVIPYLFIRATFAMTHRLFIRDNARQIRSDTEPLLRRMTVRRSVARGIDYGIVSTVLVLVAFAVPAIQFSLSLVLMMSLIFFVGIIQLSGTTPGKALLGLEVVSTSSARLSMFQLFVRELTSLLSIYILPLAVYVVVLNKNGEQMGDVFADTQVVKTGISGLDGLLAFSSKIQSTLSFENLRESSIPTIGDGNSGETTLQSSSTNTNQDATKIQSGSKAASTTLQQTASTTTGGSTNNGNPSDLNGSTTSHCLDCGDQLPSSSTFCPSCGSQIKSN